MLGGEKEPWGSQLHRVRGEPPTRESWTRARGPEVEGAGRTDAHWYAEGFASPVPKPIDARSGSGDGSSANGTNEAR